MEIISFTDFINSINLRDVFMLNRNIDSNSAGKLNAGTKGVVTLVNHSEGEFILSILDKNNVKTGEKISVNSWNVVGFYHFWDKLKVVSTKPFTTNKPFLVSKKGNDDSVDSFAQAVELLGLNSNLQFIVGSRWMVVNPCKIGDIIFNKGEIFTFDKDGFAYVKYNNLAKITLKLSLAKDVEKFTLALKAGYIKPIGFKPKKGVSYVDVITEEPIQVGSVVKTNKVSFDGFVDVVGSVYGVVKAKNSKGGLFIHFEKPFLTNNIPMTQGFLTKEQANNILQNVAHRNIPKDDLEKYSVAKRVLVEKEILVPTKDDRAVIGKHYYNADGIEYVALQCAYSPFVCKPDHTGFTTIGVRNLYEKELQSEWEYPKTMHRKPTAWVKII